MRSRLVLRHRRTLSIFCLLPFTSARDRVLGSYTSLYGTSSFFKASAGASHCSDVIPPTRHTFRVPRLHADALDLLGYPWTGDPALGSGILQGLTKQLHTPRYRRDPCSSGKKSFFQPAVSPTSRRFGLKLPISIEPGTILLLIMESMHLIHGVAGYTRQARHTRFRRTVLRASVFGKCHHGCTLSKPRDYGFGSTSGGVAGGLQRRRPVLLYTVT